MAIPITLPSIFTRLAALLPVALGAVVPVEDPVVVEFIGETPVLEA